jgi:hypothetical protein
MFGAGKQLIQRLKQAVVGDDGTATIEFVILFPAIMTIFLSSFEVSIYLTRAVLLDRALDLNVRLLRLGTLDPMTQEELQRRVCNDALIFKDCPTSIMIELTEIPTTTWDLPDPQMTCVSRDAEIDPPTFATGGLNDLMLVRACTLLDPFFGTTPLVMGMPLDPSGSYLVAAASTFVNEP